MLLAGMLVPQGRLPPVVTRKSPLAVTLVMGAAVGRLLVTVITCTELVLPTETAPKESDVGDAVTARIPLPDKFWINVLMEALSSTVNPPMFEPTRVGA
jgi:hypothetical protein